MITYIMLTYGFLGLSITLWQLFTIRAREVIGQRPRLVLSLSNSPKISILRTMKRAKLKAARVLNPKREALEVVKYALFVIVETL